MHLMHGRVSLDNLLTVFRHVSANLSEPILAKSPSLNLLILHFILAGIFFISKRRERRWIGFVFAKRTNRPGQQIHHRSEENFFGSF